MPKVSIIVPIYNAEKTLAACLGNLVHQTLEDIEIILVNDCSTDNSLQIILDCEAQFPDKILVVNSDVNRGAGGARNVGLYYATGEYIGFVDSDDIVVPDMFKKLYYKAVEGDYDIVDCGFYNEETDTAIIYTSDELAGELNGYKRNELIASGGYFVSKIFKKSFIDSLGLIFRENCILEDCETLMLAFAKAENIGNVKEILYNYKYYPKSLSRGIDIERRFTNMVATMQAMEDVLFGLDNYAEIQEAVEYAIVNFCVLCMHLCYLDGVSESERELKLSIVARYFNNLVKLPIRGNRYINNKVEKKDLDILEKTVSEYTSKVGVCDLNKDDALDARGDLVSVIIPTHNRKDTLKRAIDSVLAQTYKNIEIIVVDDASTDGTAQCMEEWYGEYDNIIYVINDSNVGAAGSRNIGATYANGKYLAFHDSDDVWLSDKLEKQMAVIKENQEYEVVYCPYIFVKKDEEVIVPLTDFPTDFKRGYIFPVLLATALIGTITLVINKDIFFELGGFNIELKSLEDYEFSIRIAEKYKIGFVEEPLAVAYDSGNGVNRRYRERMVTYYYILEKYYDSYVEYNLLYKKIESILKEALYYGEQKTAYLCFSNFSDKKISDIFKNYLGELETKDEVRTEVKNNKIAFILCVTNLDEYSEAKRYIDNLIVPEGFETDILAVHEAPSMCEGYNGGMEATDAKYKVYMHQDVRIINKNFIADLLKVFEDASVGLVGMVGTRKMTRDGYAVMTWDTGKVYYNGDDFSIMGYEYPGALYTEAEAVDGLLFATQYDVPFREDLFTDWDFYDISIAYEHRRAGYKVVVPHQMVPWTYHNDSYSKMTKYDDNRAKFLEEYSRDFDLDSDLGVCYDTKREELIRRYIKSYETDVNNKGMAAVADEILNSKISSLGMKDLMLLARICKSESGRSVFDWNGGIDNLYLLLNELKRFIKRVEYDVPMDEEECKLFCTNYSLHSVVMTVSVYCMKMRKVFVKLADYIPERNAILRILPDVSDTFSWRNNIEGYGGVTVYNLHNWTSNTKVPVAIQSLEDENAVEKIINFAKNKDIFHNIIVFAAKEGKGLSELVEAGIPVIIGPTVCIKMYSMDMNWNIEKAFVIGEGFLVDDFRRIYSGSHIEVEEIL